ncbi:MAG: 6-phosphogluconolactonase [Gemmatimonadota bacterium]|nr:6-phosphogluconolactonase [Gemmatimonadota bacterium]
MTDRPAEWIVRASPEEAAAAAAERLGAAAREAVEARGRFAVALSGGSTPGVLFELLASRAWSGRLPWERTHVFWSDERCVPPDHPDSNYGMAARTLLCHVPVPAAHVHRIRGEEGAVAAADTYEEELRGFAGAGAAPLDVVLLGVGTDGHTASLFPGSEAERRDAAGTTRRVLPNEAETPGAARVTLTTKAIDEAPVVLFFVTGAAKSEIVARLARPAAPDGPDADLPAGRIRPAGRLAWILDAAAAADLPLDVRVR